MIQRFGELDLALLALSGRNHPISYDRLCRDGQRWPLFFELCLHVARMPESRQRDHLLKRLQSAEPAAGVVTANMIRAVNLLPLHPMESKKAIQGTVPSIRSAPEALLAEAFAENTPVPARLARCASVTLPILLVCWGGAGSDEVGFVADLTVWTLPAEDQDRVEYQPAPASFLLYLDAEFVTGLTRASDVVTQALKQSGAMSFPIMAWDVQPRPQRDRSTGTLGLAGESAAAAFALAGLWLSRASLDVELRSTLGLVDCARVAVSAGIARDLKTLEPVGGINSKIQSLMIETPGHGAAPHVFVASRQAVGGPQRFRPTRCESITEFVTLAAAATGGHLDAPQRTLLDSLLHGSAARVPENTLDAVAASDPDSIRTYLLARYAHWALVEHGRLHVRFVNLCLTDLARPAADIEGLEAARYGSLHELLHDNRHVHGFVLTGDPGAGKTTLLAQFEMDRARTGLLALERGEQDFELCVWVPLAEYPTGLATVRAKAAALRNGSGDAAATQRALQQPTPLDWLEQRWRRTFQRMPPLADLVRQHQVRILFDGVNEIQAADAAAWRQAVTGLTESIRDAELRVAAPIFSIRTLENTARLYHPGFVVHQVQVEKWTRRQMRAYCARRLRTRARTLWRHLRHDTLALELCQLPLNLSAQCEVFESGLGRAANGRAELLSGLVWVRLLREYRAGRLDAPGLLSDTDLQALNADRHWVDHLMTLPSGGALVSGLDRQAETMRAAGALQVHVNQVVAWLSRARQRQDWLNAVRGLGLAAAVPGENEWRFAHQLVLELFQARGFTRRNDHAVVTELAPPALPELSLVADSLPADAMLPGPSVSRQEEMFKLAVQLADVPDAWLLAAAQTNAALAARAAAGCSHRVGEPVMRSLKELMLKRSRDPEMDVRVRIEAATALGALGDDLRYEQHGGPLGRYLIPSDRHWIGIPGGEYRIGSGLRPLESPVTTIRLLPFELAFATVTNAEFQRFVEAGGYEDPQWWVGTMAVRWWRGEFRNEASIAFWSERIYALRTDFDAAVERYWPNELPGYVEGELRNYASWSVEFAEAELERRFGARKIRTPGLWHDPVYGAANPLLPVAGVCFIEAVAYCRWLTAQVGDPATAFTLPTEAQWEAAARGGTLRNYPWRDCANPERWRMNADSGSIRRNAPVGVFPEADTPTGLADLCGNVEELTCSAWRERLDAEALTTPALDGEERRASRGGNWSERAELCQTTTRYSQHPAHRTFRLGFRLVRHAVSGAA